MTTDPTQPLSSMKLPDSTTHPRPDRATTPMPPPQNRHSAADHRAPTTLVEQILAGIYSQILGLDHIGINESFFDLGGDSLTAMQAVTAINTALDADLGVPTLINTPTIKSLSQQIARHTNTPKEAPAPSPASDL